MAPPKLPRVFHLPFGYRILIYLVSDSQMLDCMDEDVKDKEELSDGLWDVDNRSIFIRKKLAASRRLEVFTHELDHAINDWRHWVIDTFL